MAVARPWTDAYSEILFVPDGRDHSGVDCYGLIWLVYKEQLAIELPSYAGIFQNQSFESLRRVARFIATHKNTWRQVEDPRLFDMIILRSGRYLWHVGIVVDSRRMLHIMDGINSCIEDYTGLIWKNRVEEFRRYER
jgi:cell wall-associated NlpC family hydrolase